MRTDEPSRGRKVIWPDMAQWMREFGARLQGDATASAAWKTLVGAGCVEINLQKFLYAYSFSPAFLFDVRSGRRDSALDGLTAVAGRLDRAARKMQETLNTELWAGISLAGLLLDRATIELQADPGITVEGKFSPDFALNLPSILQTHSVWLKWLRKEVQRNLNARSVKNSIYLVHLATYIEAVSGKQPSWIVIADLVNTARPATSKEKHVDSTLLRKNYQSFIRRNNRLYQDIRSATAEYLTMCARVRKGERSPSFAQFMRNRAAQ